MLVILILIMTSTQPIHLRSLPRLPYSVVSRNGHQLWTSAEKKIWPYLGGLILIVADADTALVREAVSPISTDLNIRLGNATVTNEQPKTEYRLGKDVEHGVCKNLRIN